MSKSTIKRYKKFLKDFYADEKIISNLSDHATHRGINRNAGKAALDLKLLQHTAWGSYIWRRKHKPSKVDAKLLLEKSNEITNIYR